MESKELWNEVKKEMASESVILSPKISATVRLTLTGLEFILARYKFVAKMLQNRKDLTVIDFGCNDGLGDLLISQNCDCKEIIGIDFDEDAIAWANANIASDKMKFIQHDFLEMDIAPSEGDCAVSLDVIEHIPVEKEDMYFQTICNNLKDDGIAVIGTPNVTMFPYASPWNKKAHINNYSQERLYEAAAKWFQNVFIFGMNDEVLHTGFYPMSCYIMTLCCGKRKNNH